jgi:hypothetical protein
MLAAGALAITPASAGKFLTKKKALGLFYTKAQADGRYLTQAQGDARYLTQAQGDARYLTEAQGDARYLTEAQGDARYLTQTQGDARYAPAGLTDLRAYCALLQEPRSYGPCNALATTVDTTGNVGEHTSIAIGPDGLPVVSYYDVTNGNLKVAKCNDPACSGGGETITAVDTTDDVGQYTSIAIGSGGFPVVSYYDVTNGDLKVAGCNDPACAGGDEQITSKDTAGDVGQYTSTAIGADGLPVVSYYDVTNGNLKVVKCNDATCGGAVTPTPVDAGGDVGQYTSIATGADGFPVIAYRAVANSDLKVAKCNDPACTGGDETTTLVDTVGNVGEFASIAVGTGGLPVVSHYSSTAGDLKVARCNDPACTGGDETNSTVDATGVVGQYSSIAIGADGLPVVSYWDVSNGDLEVVKCDDAACAGSGEAFTTLDTVGTVGAYTSIAIGVDGLPVISYRYFDATELKVARPPGAAVA